MRLLRKCLILTHRYLGIALSLLVIVWFASGIVMMYAGGMPQVTQQSRLERLPDLDLSQVTLTPQDAATRASESRPNERRPTRVLLSTVLGRPAFKLDNATVFADTGEVLPPASVDVAKNVAGQFVGVTPDRVEFVETRTSIDQWTLGQSRALPLHKFRVDDGAGTEVYVQAQTAEVAMLTTSRARMLAWVGTIPHWLYFAALRTNQPLWFRVVVWTSAAACVLSVLGMVLGITQFRKTRPFNLSRSIPYSGWMRWHYITGAVFGLFTLTWAYSGLLSMEPFAWTNATGLEVDRQSFNGGRTDLSAFTDLKADSWNRILAGRAIRQIEFSRIQGDDYFVVRQAPLAAEEAKQRERLHQPYQVGGQSDPDRVLVNARTLEARYAPFPETSLIERLKEQFPDTPIVSSELMQGYDSYYYSRGRINPLPALRVQFADPAETWIYVDPEMGQVLAEIHRLNRVERWLYNGLHSLDFSFWYDRRPLWDIGMLVLLLGGLITSVLGMWMGLKRLGRAVAR